MSPRRQVSLEEVGLPASGADAEAVARAHLAPPRRFPPREPPIARVGQRPKDMQGAHGGFARVLASAIGEVDFIVENRIPTRTEVQRGMSH